MDLESSDSRPEFRCESKYAKFTPLRGHKFSIMAKKDGKTQKKFFCSDVRLGCVLTSEAQTNP